MHAARNSALCTKDCLCLFVCPTGATDTENGQIDFSRCLDGCRLCVDACPSHAIYLVMDNYAPPQPKDTALSNTLLKLAASKASQENLALSLEKSSKDPAKVLLAKALERSCRILAEDCSREAGFMLPQSARVTQFLESLLEVAPDTPDDILKELLHLLKQG